MDQKLVDDFISYFKAVPKSIDGATISTNMRKDIALKMMDFDGMDIPISTNPEDSRFYIVQDMGDMSVTAIRQWVEVHYFGMVGQPEDDLLATFQYKSGKLAEPACSDIGPFYTVSRVGEPSVDDFETSARSIRRVIRDDYYRDEWNIWSTYEIEQQYQNLSGRTLRLK